MKIRLYLTVSNNLKVVICGGAFDSAAQLHTGTAVPG